MSSPSTIPSITSPSTQPKPPNPNDDYYRNLCTHAQISQSQFFIPRAFESLDQHGNWRNPDSQNVLSMRTMFLDFQSLHHMNVIHLQDSLVAECNEMIQTKTTTSDQLGRVQILLKAHSEAIRNWDAVIARPRAKNQFAAEESWRAGMTYRYLSYWSQPMTDRFSKRVQRILRRKPVQDLWQRFYMSLLGGVALIVPMLVMALNPSQNKSLITVSVAVFIFAVLIAVFSKATPENVLGVTAAYAAVLVVFVGTGSNGQ